MSYYNFISSTKNYLKSVRVIKDYISFDMSFPDKWVILKEHSEGIEIIKNKGETGRIIISFVTPFKEESINKIENTINSIIKFNIEKEEKERLFKNKVQELKSIFEDKNLDILKNLKFDIDEFTLLTNNIEENGQSSEGSGEVETTDREKSTEPKTT